MKRCKSIKEFGIYIVLFACFAALLGGCGDKTRASDVNVIESSDPYDWQYTRAFVGEKDEDMQIDGVLSEEAWQDRNWLTHCEKDVAMRYTTVFTKKGLYIAAVAEDEHMQWNDKRAFMNNSSFRFYIVSNTAEDYFCFDCLNFVVDEEDSSCRQQVRFEAEAVRSVNEAGVPTLTAEFFAAWEDLNYTVNPETGVPDFARIVPMYRYVEGFESADNAFLKPAFAEVDNNRVNNTLLFDQKGYINVGSEEAELGNAANGYAKSDGWDLSGLEGGADGVKTVRTTAEHGQAIFFQNIESSRYSYSVDMKLTGGINDTAPSAGVCDMKSAAEFNCMRIAGVPYLESGKKALTYNTLDFYETLWHDVLRGDRIESAGSDIINIRVIKDDTRYYYIINDVYAFSLDLDWLGGQTCPGLYSLGAQVEYSGWEAVDYEGEENDAAFCGLTDEYMHVIKVSDRVSGGTLSLNKLAVAKGSGEAVELTVKSSKGYILTDLLINGSSEYDRLVPHMKDGVIELYPQESMMIDAVFTPLPAESCIRVTGQTAQDNGTAVIGLPFTLQSQDTQLTKLLSWQDVTTSSGMFDIMLLRAGEYELGGRTFAADGMYTLSFEGTFPEGEQHVFAMDTGEERFEGQSFYDWGTITLNPFKARNMEEDSEGNVRTTNTDYSDEYSYFVYNEMLEGDFRLDMTIKAANDKWPCYGFTLEDEYGGSVQFFAAGTSTYRIMRNYDGWYTQSDRGVTFADNESRLALVYDEAGDRIYFYVNDVLFDSVKRSDYLTGTGVRYGIVGYMSGADGSFRHVTKEDPFAVFTKPAVTTEFSVTAPKEARLTLNGERIDGKSVPVLSEIAVAIPVSGSRQYVIYLDGKPLETIREDGEIRAVFTVTGPHRVEYDIAYITEWIHDPFEYDSASGGYRVRDHMKTANGGYLTGSSVKQGDAFLFEAVIRDMDTSQWPSAGLLVGSDAEHYVRFSVIRNTDARPNQYAFRVGNADGKELVKWFSNIETLADNNPFGTGGQMKLGLAYENGYYYVFINESLAMAFDENELLSGEISIRDSLGGRDKVKLGLFAERRAAFTRWTYSSDTDSCLARMREMEWIHRPLLFDKAAGYYRVLDHDSVANGGYFKDAYIEQKGPFMLETTVRDMDTALWPSVGLLVGTDAEHYVRFSVIRNTDTDPHTYALRAGNAQGKEIVRWFSDNSILRENLPFGAEGDGDMKLALVYDGSCYYMFVNDKMVTAFGENELLSNEISIRDSLGQGNVRPGLFAERKITFVNWEYSGDLSRYLGNIPGMEWIHSPLMYDAETGRFLAADHNSLANGGYFRNFARKPGETFLVEAGMWNMDTAFWPSAGVIVGTDAGHYVRFSIIRNTDADPDVYGLRVGNAGGKEIVKWFSDIETLADNKPFGADEKGIVKLSVAYRDGYYYVFINDKPAVFMSENELLSGQISIRDSLGSGNVKAGLFAERQITFTGWNYSADPSGYLKDMPRMEWIHSPLIYDFATGRYQVTDHNSVANGGYFTDFSVRRGESFLVETSVRDMDRELWPSAGLIVGTDAAHYVRFSVVRNTDASPNVYGLRLGSADGCEIVKWFADLDGLQDNLPFGADEKGEMKLAMAYDGGYYYLFINGVQAAAFSGGELLSGRISIDEALGSGDVKAGLFAERKATFVNWNYTSDEDEVLSRLPSKEDQGRLTVKVTGVDTGAAVTVTDGSGNEVHSAQGGFTVDLPEGNYLVSAAGAGAVAQTQTAVVAKGGSVEVTLETMTKLEAASYTINGGSWTADTAEFTFEPATGIYRGAYGSFNTGVLAQPASVGAGDSWVLEGDVQIIADWQYPSAGFALYNGSDLAQNVKFEIVRATVSETDKDSHERLVRVNGKNYIQGQPGDAGAEHSDWVAANQEALKGRVHMALVHADSGYYLFLNGELICGITGQAAENLTNGWGSIRPGFYAEQEAAFENWSYSTDISGYESKLPAKETGSLTVKVTGVDTGAAVTVTDGSGNEVHSAQGGFTVDLPEGSYLVSAAGAGAVAQTQTAVVTKGGSVEVTLETMTKLEAASYTINGGSWTADTAEFTFEPATGIYRGAYGSFNTGVLAQPVSVGAGDSWVLEGDVQIIADWQYPSAGFALYNGSDLAQNVKFEIVRATVSETDKDGHERLVRVNGKNYIQGQPGDAGAEHSDWVAANQEALKGRVHMALVHADSGYYLFLNGTAVCGITGQAAENLTNGWGSIRPGFYAEQEAIFENWSYSTDISGYESKLPPKMEWIHNPLVYDLETGQYRVTDHNSTANGGWFAGFSQSQGAPFLVEASVRDMDTSTWPSAGLIVGTDASHYVRFSVIRNTDASPNTYALRVGNADGKEIVNWFADLDGLQDNLPFGADGNGNMKLAAAYKDGSWYVLINDKLVLALDEGELLSETVSIRDSLGTGDIKAGLFAERMITFVNWSYSTDLSGYLDKLPATANIAFGIRNALNAGSDPTDADGSVSGNDAAAQEETDGSVSGNDASAQEKTDGSVSGNGAAAQEKTDGSVSGNDAAVQGACEGSFSETLLQRGKIL